MAMKVAIDMKLEPIIPYEPMRANEISEGDQWIAQVKWDGVRILTYFDGDRIKLFNRKRNERTLHYPELVDIASYCTAKSVILDGEVIALGEDGKPSFHEVMRRDAIRRPERIQEVQKQVHIAYMIFDIIYYNDEWIHSYPLKERMTILEHTIQPSELVQLVPSYQDANALFKLMEQQQMEGIVMKDVTSKYRIGSKDDRWRKIKVYRDLIAVVGGVTLSHGIVNSMLLGLYDNFGNLHYIGRAGTGKLKKEDWRILTDEIRPLQIERSPFANPVPGKQIVWIQPLLAVKVAYAEWTEGRSMRQPSIQAFVDVPPHECRFP